VTKFADWRRLQGQMREAGEEITTAADVALAEKIYHGRVGERTRKFFDETVKPFTAEMRAAGIDRAELDNYLWARAAEERNAKVAELYRVDQPDHPFARAMDDPTNLEGIDPSLIEDGHVKGGSGFTNAWARKTQADLEAGPRGAALKALGAKFDAMNRARQDTEVAAGLKSQQQVDAERAAYKHYAPFRGHEGVEEINEGRGSGAGFQVKGKETQRALGRASRPESAIGHAFAMSNNAIVRAERNRVFKTLLRLAEQHPHEDLWEVARPERKRTVGKSQGLAWRIGDDGTPETYHADQVKEQMAPVDRNAPDVVVGKIGGKEELPPLARGSTLCHCLEPLL
jgi:hypothetical protein